MDQPRPERRVAGYCALCRSRCGCISVVRDGSLVAVEPDPSHPTGRSLCAKGRAAPELVHSPDRLLHPMRRTRPKGDPDPGWQRIGWDEALAATADALARLAAEAGPESVAFAVTTPSGTAMSDSIMWVERLMRAFGTPNDVYSTEICNWHKDVAPVYTFGDGIGMPDLANTGCVVLWGHNPSTAWLSLAQLVSEARARGCRLIVVDPRRVGLANKADHWLRVRPGSDGALALGLANVMIEEGWYDDAFLRDWSNGPFLVRLDEQRLLTEADLVAGGRPGCFVAWDADARRPVVYDPTLGAYEGPTRGLSLFGRAEVPTANGVIACRPSFDLYAELCRSYPPARVEALTWVPADMVRETAHTLWHARPVSYYAWSGVGQHTNATQTDRAISLLYALTGSWGDAGGNLQFATPPMNDVSGRDLISDAQQAKALGLKDRPLGPPKDCWVTSDDLYRAVTEKQPYAIRGLVGFGANLLLSHAEAQRGAAALAALEFHLHADLFLTPTAAFADIVMPVNTPWEREGLRPGFEISQDACSLVQMRPAAVDPVGESRSDTWIVFELAKRLGLGNMFWNGDVDAGYREMLAPSGVDLDALRGSPSGIRVPMDPPYRSYAEHGLKTPSRKVEVWSETFRENGYPPLPEFVEPAVGPNSRPDTAARYPLVLTSSKNPHFCHSQHRNLPRLRRVAPHPLVEIHPDTADARGIAEGDWVAIETETGRVRAKATLKPALDPRVVAAQHGWWQACSALDLPGFDAVGEASANLNAAIGNASADPISGSVAHRSYLCEVSRVDGTTG